MIHIPKNYRHSELLTELGIGAMRLIIFNGDVERDIIIVSLKIA